MPKSLQGDSRTAVAAKLIAVAVLLSMTAPAALAQKQLLAMGMPRMGGHVAPKFTSIPLRNRHGQNHQHHQLPVKIEHGAYTKLDWKAKKAAAEVKPAVKPVVVTKPAVKTGLNISSSSSRVIGPGVVYKVFSGRTRVNMLDINMSTSPLVVRPMTAASTFHGLKDVHDHVRDAGALAAINANYFKSNGTPLGTLMLDGEWLSGPLYSRVALGFTEGGYARIARVGLHGILHTSIPGHESLWINNINQPRHSGSHCVLFTRRWGERFSMPYDGTIVAVNAAGEVIDIDSRSMTIPHGGFVLADAKKSPIAALSVGDKVNVDWSISPKEWTNVTSAISGGPLLLKNGKIAFDLKGEKFPASWTGSNITRRTACGITADDHLLMATFEGPHTLYDVAKFFLNHGCNEAMNLDGGGSTTMVVNGQTVTKNATASQRRVAVALGLFAQDRARNLANNQAAGYHPQGDIASLLSAVETNFVQPAQSTVEASGQLSELCPVAPAVQPDSAVARLTSGVLKSPYQEPVNVELSEVSSAPAVGSAQTEATEELEVSTLGQLDVPGESVKAQVTKSSGSAKLNSDLEKR
jgi:uncharacterized protein YigE (DUF2233 family)